jgi:hypothetical protein
MDQEDKTEQQTEATEETTPAETTAGPAETGKPKKKTGMTPLILLAVFVVVAVMTIVQMNKGNASGGCYVVPRSAFGQAPQQQWIEADTAPEADYLASFSLSVPEQPSAKYTEAHYWVYTSQIYEIRYANSNDEEGLRITKGNVCGNPVYDVDQKYKSTNIIDIDGKEVTEYGDETTVSIATWVDGDYSYCIGAWNDPLTKETMDALIAQVK